MTISDYIRELDEKRTLNEQISSALADYHAHEEYAAIKTWDEAGGYMVKQITPDQIGTDDGDDTDRILSDGIVRRFLKTHGITEYEEKRTAKHIIHYVPCPWSESHTTTSDNHTDSFISVSMSGVINYRCNHTHCDGKYWRDYKKYYEDRDGKDTKEKDVEPRHFDIKLVQGKKLQEMNLPPIVYPVENMIPEGYTVGSAPFKFGKSWLALEMCLAIAQGIPFLGQPTTKGSAIYMALEDCDKFAQERLNMVLDGKEAPEGFYYIYDQVPRLDDGFIDYLNQLYDMVPDIRLVVIDVLALIEYESQRKESAYKCDYRTGTALKKWADEHGTSILAITHTTKMIHPNDVFMNTTGTNGVTGSADAILTIAKESRTDKEGILAITGRRVREKYFKVRLRDGYIWETDGEIDPVTMQTDAAQLEKEERLAEYRSSDIRTALVKLSNLGIKTELSSRDIIDKAREQDIYLLNTPAEIGLFIHKFQNHFTTEDGIRVYIRKRGTGSNLYRFETWEPAEEIGDTEPWDDS